MDFGLLGPVEVWLDGRPLSPGHARQRAVLAVLLMDVGQVVPLETLIDRVWGEDPPRSVRSAVYGYVARLRALVATAGEPDVALSRRAGGYLLQVVPDRVDMCRFRRLVAAAAAEDDERAARLLGEAVGVWRGQALAGLDSPWLNGMRVRLELEHTAAIRDLTDLRLRRGEHAALASELAGQAVAEPADERLIGQLMLALYRCGRQAEALAWFERTRQYLDAELAASPTPELRALHEQMLRADPALAPLAPDRREEVLVAGDPPGSQRAIVPHQLPAAVPQFTGRAAELEALTQMLDQAGAAGPGTVVISAIGGTAGVGKTALALHWAHQVAARFDDGQLHVNLRGFDPSGRPATAAEAIRGFLDALGVPPERIPATPAAQTGLYRDLLAGKRMLILLDNARDEQHVRPLLPASPGSLVLVTSRSQLGGLVAATGARLLILDVLSHAEAVHMLAARLGTARAVAEPTAVDRIASLCACLPLALAVAAARAAASPGFPLSALAGELADSANRLDTLDTGDPASSVRAVFSWSTRQLSDEALRMFRLLGLHPGPDISVPAAASLASRVQPQTRRQLRELARAHLITEHVPGRYALHDLLRAYAAEQASHAVSEPDRDAATGRVLDHYLHTAAHASRLVNPSQERTVLGKPRAGTAPGQPAGYPQALAWFEAELQVLLAAVAFAAESGSDTHACQLAWTMTDFMYRRGHWHENAATQRTALAAATRLGDTAAQALSSRLLANTCGELGDHDQARGHYAYSLTLYQRLGNRLGEAKIQQSLCLLAAREGRYADGLKHAKQALRIAQAIGSKAFEAEVLNFVGWCHCLLDDYHQARALCQESISLSAEADHRWVEGSAWDSLGYAEHHLGNLTEAAACYQRALGMHREAGFPHDEADTLIHLGDTRHAAGEPAQAREAWQQALAILDDLQRPDAVQIRAKLADLDGEG